MTCRRAFDVDLAGFLRDPRAPELAEFVDHYPRCPDCAGEVRAWTEVHLGLGASHPAPADLLAFQDGTLSEHARAAVQQHVAGCPSCAEELRAVRRFDAGTTESIRADPEAARPTPRRLARMLWHPAVAYGVALLVVASAVLQRRGEVTPAVRVAAREAAPPLAAPRLELAVPPPEAAREPGEDSRGAGAAPAAKSSQPTSAPPTLLPGRAPTLDLRSQSITIPLPPALGTASGLEVRIRDEAGKRELLQRFDAPTREGVVVAQLPTGWLALGGAWEVELRAPGVATSPVQRFTVQVPHRLRD
jgi:hypothetical protein